MAEGSAIVLIMDNAPYHRRNKDRVPSAKNFCVLSTAMRIEQLRQHWAAIRAHFLQGKMIAAIFNFFLIFRKQT
jgi:hypothetical protein